MDKDAAVLLTQTKSVGVAVALAIFFGGLGLLYASVAGGIVMTIVELLTLVIAAVTLGIGAILFPFVHIIAVIWAIVAVNGHNSKLLANVSAEKTPATTR